MFILIWYRPDQNKHGLPEVYPMGQYPEHQQGVFSMEHLHTEWKHKDGHHVLHKDLQSRQDWSSRKMNHLSCHTDLPYLPGEYCCPSCGNHSVRNTQPDCNPTNFDRF